MQRWWLFYQKQTETQKIFQLYSKDVDTRVVRNVFLQVKEMVERKVMVFERCTSGCQNKLQGGPPRTCAQPPGLPCCKGICSILHPRHGQTIRSSMCTSFCIGQSACYYLTPKWNQVHVNKDTPVCYPGSQMVERASHRYQDSGESTYLPSQTEDPPV